MSTGNPAAQGNEPLRKTMCKTCPFRPGSPYANLADDLATAAITKRSRVCHSTGSDNAINKHTSKPPHLCRGARNVQLSVMAAFGAIEAATDKAWNKMRVKLGMKPTTIKDP
jgi:hypothetical protein